MTINGEDIPTVQLKALRQRKIRKADYNRIAASIQAVGLIEPLIVFKEKDHFVILDGHIRFTILVQMGLDSIPCIVWKEKEAFTGNRMVNRLSPVQEVRMLKKSLEELDAKTIAEALALKQLSGRLNTSLLTQLSPRVAIAFDTNKITKACARDLTFVVATRQNEILDLMTNYNDYSAAFAQAMILKTPPPQRAKTPKRAKTPAPSANFRNVAAPRHIM